MASAFAKEYVLLTNSFGGVKRDIEALGDDIDSVIMFGIDKNLKGGLRIEKAAEKDGTKLFSAMDLESIGRAFEAAGLNAVISETPTHYLCNEAYWYALKRFGGKAVFIHIPTLKFADEAFIEKIAKTFKK